MSITYAARQVDVNPSTWHAWENGNKIPDRHYMRLIFIFTRGQVRPDHFHDLPQWRAELSRLEKAA